MPFLHYIIVPFLHGVCSLVTVHSESVEEQEESRVLSPQQKELAEIWLLSMADALLTRSEHAHGGL